MCASRRILQNMQVKRPAWEWTVGLGRAWEGGDGRPWREDGDLGDPEACFSTHESTVHWASFPAKGHSAPARGHSTLQSPGVAVTRWPYAKDMCVCWSRGAVPPGTWPPLWDVSVTLPFCPQFSLGKAGAASATCVRRRVTTPSAWTRLPGTCGAWGMRMTRRGGWGGGAGPPSKAQPAGGRLCHPERERPPARVPRLGLRPAGAGSRLRGGPAHTCLRRP